MSLRQHSRMKVDVTALSERSALDDFREMFMASVGDISDKHIRIVSPTKVLIATYVAPRRTAGGIILADKTVDEDRWQCKLGLVLKLGPAAFKYAGQFKYEGVPPVVGDYVTFERTSAANEIGIRGMSCRWIESELIDSVITDPSIIY